MRVVEAGGWFRVTRLGDGVTLVEEPHADPLLAANLWHLSGRDRDLVVDAGLGVAALRPALPWLFERDPVLVLTHSHLDHAGGAHEFADVRVHAAELALVHAPAAASLHGPTLLGQLGMAADDLDEPLPDLLLDALPEPGYDPAGYAVAAAPAARAVHDGDVLDLGDRAFTVLHLPGHTPGSLALHDLAGGTLLTGDVVYEGGLIDSCRGSDVGAYRDTMRRLLDLAAEGAVRQVLPGHGRVLDLAGLRAIAAGYLAGG